MLANLGWKATESRPCSPPEVIEAAQVRVRLRRDLPVADRADRALLLDDEEALVAGRRGDVDGRAQPVGDLGEPEGACGAAWRAEAGSGCERAAERGEGEGEWGLHVPQPTRDAARSGITSAPHGAVLRGGGRRARSLVRGLERRRAPAAARAGRPAPRGRGGRAVRALRERAARAPGRRRRAAAALRVPPGHAPGARSPRAPGAARAGSRRLVARAATRARPRARRRGGQGLRSARRPRRGMPWPPATTCIEVECDRFLLLELDRATISSDGPARAAPAGRASRAGSEQEAWRLEARAARRARHQRAVRPGDVRRLARARARGAGQRAGERARDARRPTASSPASARLRVCVARAADGLPRVHGRGRVRARPGARPGAQARRDPARRASSARGAWSPTRVPATSPCWRSTSASATSRCSTSATSKGRRERLPHRAARALRRDRCDGRRPSRRLPPVPRDGARRVPPRARAPVPRAARSRRHRVRGRRRRHPLPRAAALRRRVHA